MRVFGAIVTTLIAGMPLISGAQPTPPELSAQPAGARQTTPAAKPVERAPLPPVTTPRGSGALITRADLSDAHARFERVYAAHPPAAESIESVNRAYDAATVSFFAGEHSRALRELNELSASLAGAEANPVERYLDSLKVRIGPQIAHATRPSVLAIKFTPLYTQAVARPIPARMSIVSDKTGQEVLSQAVEFAPGQTPPIVRGRQPEVASGSYTIRIAPEPGSTAFAPRDVGRWYAVNTSLDLYRQSNELRFGGLYPRDLKMAGALESLRARNGLLGDQINETDGTCFLTDPVALSEQVEKEIQSFIRGVDPYENRAGDYFRVFMSAAMRIPTRIHAPAPALQKGEPLPVLIALHGEGGDENTFFEAYGLGQIKAIAEKNGLLVVSPNLAWVLPNPGALPSLLDGLSQSYNIDRTRVYVVGHSLGAVAATKWTTDHADKLAGAVLIAGGAVFADGKTPCPTLVMGGQIDGIQPVVKLERLALDAKAAGLPVDFKAAEGLGHTLIVHAKLAEAINWLAGKSRRIE